MEKRIETRVDEFLMRLRREKRMTLPELEKAMGLSQELLEKWIALFEARGFVELIYPPNPIDPPYVVIKDGK